MTGSRLRQDRGRAPRPPASSRFRRGVPGPWDADQTEPGRCRRIWRRALLQAVRDLCGIGEANETPSLGTAVERWLGTRPSRDFRAVCDLAEIDCRVAHATLKGLAGMPPRSREAVWRSLARGLEEKEETGFNGRGKTMTEHYKAVVPVSMGKDRTRYVAVGVMFENTTRGERTYFRLKLDFPVAVTEILLFPPRPETGGEGGAPR